MNDRPWCYVRGALARDWVAHFLGRSAVRRALRDELEDLPPGYPRESVLDFFTACHIEGKVWRADMEAAAIGRGETEVEVSSEHGDEIDTNKAAAMLGLSTRRILQLVQAGQLPARRVGGRWRFSLSEIEGRLHGEL